MYVAVKGGQKAIANAHRLLAEARRGDTSVAEIGVDQITEQLSLAVDRVMAEGSLYAPQLAALAIKQARGDLVEAIFILRAFRTTLCRLGSSLPLDTEKMRIKRRISSAYKDLPGGQVLGPTFDYTHRLLDPQLLHTTKDPQSPGEISDEAPLPSQEAAQEDMGHCPRALDFLEQEGLLPPPDGTVPDQPVDITRQPLILPAGRDAQLQNLARGDEGLLLALAYSTQRGYGSTHPFVGEIRMGTVEVSFVPAELGFPVVVGELPLTECETINKFHSEAGSAPTFTRGYGLSFGENERKAMSMALVDRALQSPGYGEAVKGPAQDEEFVLYHSDNVEASGFVQHLKLPHYVDFQAELSLVRGLRREWQETASSMEEEKDLP
jgi:alpha-D-ribose 1-methylphosphonate 5-triphosphate synthase subunit PhnI